MERDAAKRIWTIEVCKTCSRLAVWPFCEHRPDGYVPPGTPSWCELVRVREVGTRKRP